MRNGVISISFLNIYGIYSISDSYIYVIYSTSITDTFIKIILIPYLTDISYLPKHLTHNSYTYIQPPSSY